MRSGVPLTNRGLTEFLAYRLKRSGTERIAPHRLRASAATHLVGAGMNIGFVQQILGHKRLDTTRIYVQIHAGELKAVLERSHPRTDFEKRKVTT
jgi:site-specific recombinase XerD